MRAKLHHTQATQRKRGTIRKAQCSYLGGALVLFVRKGRRVKRKGIYHI
jgi:hypothetical protein